MGSCKINTFFLREEIFIKRFKMSRRFSLQAGFIPANKIAISPLETIQEISSNDTRDTIELAESFDVNLWRIFMTRRGKEV